MKKTTLYAYLLLFPLVSLSLSLTALAQEKLLPPYELESSAYGNSVFFSGDRGFVGHRYSLHDNGGENAHGSAHYYEYDGSQWVHKAELVPEDGSVGRGFGSTMALYDDRVLIGADYGDGLTIYNGVVYSYRFVNDTWELEDILYASDGVNEDLFGANIVLTDQYAFIGAHQAPNQGYGNVGVMYVFKYENGAWVEQVKLADEDPLDSGQYGKALAANNDMLLVCNSNKLHVYQNSGSTWEETQMLDLSDVTVDVAFEGDIAVVGMNQDDEMASNAGAASVLRYTNGVWQEEVKLHASDAEENDYFGTAVDIADGRIMVSALESDQGQTVTGSGKVYVYSYDGNAWVEEAVLAPADGEIDDRFGIDVHFDGDIAYIASPRNDELSFNNGAVYIYDLTQPAVTNFTLIDAEADVPIPAYDPIPANAEINLADLPTNRLSVRANTAGPVESVRLSIDGRGQTENVPPYALFGDNAGDYRPRIFKPGTRVITATPYTENNTGGSAGETASVTITFTQTSASRTAQFGTYPNPFNPTTNVNFELAQEGHVRLVVYDVLGRKVQVLFDGWLSAGSHQHTFKADGLVSGFYFASLEAAGEVQVLKMLLSK